MQQCLMLGAGFGQPKRRLLASTSAPEEDTRWWTVDINPDAKPNRVFDLERLEVGDPLPYDTEYFDEVHAYEILEHLGRQGDFKGLFSTFRAIWRVLKVGGLLMGTTPSLQSPWLWGDPGHTRAITQGTLSFLTKDHYEQLGETACSDYRKYVEPCWWELEHSTTDENKHVFALRKVR